MNASQLLAQYNAAAAQLGEQQVKRFSDLKTAQRRTAAILARLPQPKAKTAAASYVRGTCPKCGGTSDITCGQVVDRKSGQVVINEHQAHCHGCGHEFNYDTGRAITRNAGAGARAFGGAESWADPAVRAARVTRNAVRVNDQLFSSVAHAFEQLNLPMSKHIAFRGQLKAAGTLEAFGRKWEVQVG
jgi:hypothetical protein